MIAKKLALTSGKGGSGKTTLGLSIATLLSHCDIKVLLVDCDLSTNGATYFYENRLSEGKENIFNFNEVFYNQSEINDTKKEFIKINQYFDFMPSIVSIDDKLSAHKVDIGSNVSSFFQDASNEYEVIIFDCQAGYSDVLKYVLPIIDLNLSVMESDAISSSAMRSLYLKIGNLLNDKKSYQVFNKATPEEYDIYSKISGGTLFTNIETILFDWKIRKAFSLAQIPDIETTSAKFGTQLLSICNVLFSETTIQNKLKKFSTILKIRSHSEKISDLNKKINELKDPTVQTFERRTYRKIPFFSESNIILVSLLSLLSLLLTFCYACATHALDVDLFVDIITDNIQLVFCIVFFTMALVVGLTQFLKARRRLRNVQMKYDTELTKYKKELAKYEKEKDELTNKLNTSKEKSNS